MSCHRGVRSDVPLANHIMATISVVQFNSSPHKLNVLQQSSNVNANNNEQRREIIILRKPTQTVNQTKQDVLVTNTSRKKNKNAKETQNTHKPAPIAVARRNARERNRVKQVNNGFANLRQHIPNSIAAAFESASGRGGNKKLSKVETLRMAVEYIRSLEDLLASSEQNASNESNRIDYPSPSSSLSPSLQQQTMSYSYPVLSPSADEDDLSTNPTPPPQQFIRIQGSNAFQVIPAHLYDDSENLEPLDEHILSDPSLLSSDLEFSGVQDLTLLSSIQTNDSLSPEMYSDSSLSPNSGEKPQGVNYIPVFNSNLSSPEQDIKFRLSPPLHQIKTENPHVCMSSNSDSLAEQKPCVEDVMDWWEQQTNRS